MTERPPSAGKTPSASARAAELDEDLRRLRLALRVERSAPPPAGARLVDERDTLEGKNGDRHHGDRFVIVGMGRFGRAVVRELLRVDGGGSRFLLVERSEATYNESAEHFSDEERARFELLLGDAVTPAAMARIERYAPTAVIVCTDNDLSNLRLAVDLRRRELRAVTRLFDLEAAPELHAGLNERGIRVVGISRLFRAAIPILTHERRLLGCINLDVAHTPEVDHLFYLSRVTPAERARLGKSCVAVRDLPGGSDAGAAGSDGELALVWHRAIHLLSTSSTSASARKEPAPASLAPPARRRAGQP